MNAQIENLLKDITEKNLERTERSKKIDIYSHEILGKIDEGINQSNAQIEELDSILEIFEFMSEILEEIDEEFLKVTKLDKRDFSCIVVGSILQTTRWFFFPSEKNKQGASEGDKKTKEILKKIFGEKTYESKGREPRKIVEILTEKVPYDRVIKGTSGRNHRIKSLGHDPILGLIFGTMDILVNTMTTTETIWRLSALDANENYEKEIFLFQSIVTSTETIKEEPLLLAVSLARQLVHLSSDYKTKIGLPIPFINIPSSQLGEYLNKHNYDFSHVVEHSLISYLINTVVLCLHIITGEIERDEIEKFSQTYKRGKILEYSNYLSLSMNSIYLATTSIKKIDHKRIDIVGWSNALKLLLKSDENRRELRNKLIIKMMSDKLE